MIRQAIEAGKAGDRSELLKSDKLNAWTKVKMKESFYEVRQEDDDWKSIVQQILHNSTDLVRRIIVPVGGQGGVSHAVVRVPSLSSASA